MRNFISPELKITQWEDILPYFEELNQRAILTLEEFENWLSDKNELDAILEEDCGWRYIKMTIDTTNEVHSKAYELFISEIQPKIAPWDDKLNQKLIASEFSTQLKDEAHRIYFRSVSTSLELFQEANIDLEAKVNVESQKYGAISAAQTIDYQGESITMQRASNFLKEQNPEVRKTVFDLISNRRAEDREKLDELFNELIKLRHQIAINAGFQNFRDYKFKELGRFNYGIQDCLDFHASVKKCIVPIAKELQLQFKKKLGTAILKPWDTEIDPEGKSPLKPFENGKDLLEGCIRMFDKIDPYFGNCLREMDKMGHLDLDSKAGKAPGGYNYPLYESNVPFIFMNAVGSQRDLVTMVHEGGHAVHSFLSADLKLTSFKNIPSEIAELASMSMELISMENWDEFYSSKDELKRAKYEQLKDIIKILPWIAQIDEFQHWIYTNSKHTNSERTEKWNSLNLEYGTGVVDWTGYESTRENSWQRQLHLFEVPFYYIEYGIAQLGAIGVWKNYKENKTKGLDSYKNALKQGYTRELKDLYDLANVKFDFSEKQITVLSSFIRAELEELV